MMMALQIKLLPNKDQTVKTDRFWAPLLAKVTLAFVSVGLFACT